MRGLLDVNVLIALHDSDHVHHAVAARWLQDNAGHGWASCPLTQNGCLRIMAQPGYGTSAKPPRVAAPGFGLGCKAQSAAIPGVSRAFATPQTARIRDAAAARGFAEVPYAQPQPLAALVNMLARSTATRYHQFWPDDISLLDAAHFRHAHTHTARHLTDLYLLALAVQHGGRLVTFDQRIPLSAAPQARAEHLVVL
jgi:predicted nucleic acid-binding protein